jgi:methylthioribose-1-phosphate isomerase
MEYRCLAWRDGTLRVLDQRLLPHEVKYIDYTSYAGVAESIRDMVVRGAPAIGAAAAYGLAVAAWQHPGDDAAALRRELEEAAGVLKAARPTAVNLFWAVDRVMAKVTEMPSVSIRQIRQTVLAEANAIAEEIEYTDRQIGLNALPLVPDNAAFIHHCNTGPLATLGYGTALGVIHMAHEKGKKVFVFVDETRPRLQGARLTSWELQQMGIPHAVIADGASGFVMKYRKVDLAVVGCDRVALNGDTANKIGTYNLAIVAKAHGVPFYIVGPTSTIDLSTPNGDAIHIEERPAAEITHIGSEQITPEGAAVFNPAFDVTPASYITAIITEAGIAYPPYEKSLPEMVAKAKAYWQNRRASAS